MNENHDKKRHILEGEQSGVKESTLLPMLFGGLALIVISAGVVMTIV